MRLGLSLAALAALLPAVAWCQPADSDTAQIDAPAGAQISISANGRGDVSLTIESEIDTPGVLSGLVQATLGCTLPSMSYDPGMVSGICPHMIPSRRGFANGRLDLAPLVAAMHAAGQQSITLEATPHGSMHAAGANWETTSRGSGRSRYELVEFISRSEDQLPSPLTISMGHLVNPVGLLIPIAVVLFVPGLFALWLERRKGPAALLWLNWLVLTTWLYWLSAFDVTELAAFAGGLDINPAVALAIGAIFFSIPPLLSIASCIIALAPRLLPGAHRWDEFGRLLKRTLAGTASFLVPLGIFLVGSGMLEYGRGVFFGSMLAAYIAWRALKWWAARGAYLEMRALDHGEFFDRVKALARKAGVQLKRVYLFRNHRAREANAFAFSDGRVAITESLLRNLTRREVDAVMAHELGHLKGRHVGVQSGFYWIFFLLAGPSVDFFIRTPGLPGWIRSVPIASALFTLAMAYLSKRHEFSADARAAEITGDPEAKIAALARLARLTSAPLDWGGIQGSIMSHPSMKSRVLSIAKHSGLPEQRALDLLENPDLLETGLARLNSAVDPASMHYSLPPELEHRDPVFTTTAKTAYHRKSNLVEQIAIVALLTASAVLISFVFPVHSIGKEFLSYVASLPLTFWLILRIDHWMRQRFYAGLAGKIRPRVSVPGGTFVGLLPGQRIVRTEGCGEWDLGFLFLDRDRLVYRGERAEFSLLRSEIVNVHLDRGPFSWWHPSRVVIQWTRGAFSIQRPEIPRSRRPAERLLSEIQTWRTATVDYSPGDQPPPGPPALPQITGDYVPKPRVAFWAAKETAKIFFVCALLESLLSTPAFVRAPLLALVPFTAALLWILSAVPTILMRRPRAVDPGPLPAPLPQPVSSQDPA
jgi:Zn-dependent protease with chaperone function